MNNQRVVPRLLWSALAVSLLLCLGGWRYYRIAPALRFPEHEAIWRALPLIPLALVAGALLLRWRVRRRPGSPTVEAEQPY